MDVRVHGAGPAPGTERKDETSYSSFKLYKGNLIPFLTFQTILFVSFMLQGYIHGKDKVAKKTYIKSKNYKRVSTTYDLYHSVR